MVRLAQLLVRGLLALGCLFFLSIESRAQGCCPEPGTCNPCNGGISKFTFRFHGLLPTLVRATDNADLLFFNIVSPGSTFSINGPANGNFGANLLNLYLAGSISPNAQIRTNCTLNYDPATFYGVFTIVSVESKAGGPMCCTSNTGSVTPPEIFGCPGNLLVTTGSACSGVATWTEPTAPDCDVISLTSTHASGSAFPVGVTTVTYTATNSNGLSSSCSFTVTVTDGTSPHVISPTPAVVVNAGSDCKAAATWTAPVFSDNCAVTSVTSSHSPGAVFSLGTTTVSYTARDAAGNTQTSKFTVTVKDATPPAVTNCPADITVEASAACTATASWSPPAFSDACSSLTVTSTHVPGSSFPAGNSTVVYTGTDAAGNVTLCSFNVFVTENTPPGFTSCPRDTIISSTAIGGVRYAWTPPVATDACSPVQLSATHTPGEEFPLGVTSVVYTATDLSGNTTQCTFTVTVRREETALNVSQLLTPDGDTMNDSWVIGNIELYRDNKVTVVDRWGSVIYSNQGYDNERRAWKGQNAQGTLVPSGTYFYVISVRSGTETMETRGFIEVIR